MPERRDSPHRPVADRLGSLTEKPLVLVLTIVVIGVLTGVAIAQATDGVRAPETILPAILVVGTIGLIAALAALVGIFSSYRITDRRHALGLPEGTVRAVIALLLILIFAVVAIYLHGRTIEGAGTDDLRGLTQQQATSIPLEQIASVRPNEENPELRDVIRVRPQNEAADELALQLLTTVSTLVVAISAFYFGANSVDAARRAVRGGEAAPTALTGDARWDGGTAELRAFVDTHGRAATYHFEYGETTAYGKQSEASQLSAGDGERSVGATIRDLEAGKTYHYRIVVRTTAGTATGEDRALQAPT